MEGFKARMKRAQIICLVIAFILVIGAIYYFTTTEKTESTTTETTIQEKAPEENKDIQGSNDDFEGIEEALNYL